MEQAHPGVEQGDMLHLVFGDIAGTPGDAYIGQQHIKEAAVVGYVQNRGILGHMFFADDRNCGTGDADAQPENRQYNFEGAGVPKLRGEFSDDPFCD